ncbi:MAG TPA: hypothetical protein PKY53_04740 [Clostridia bacterium]|nr:hypothetical protein [Clostridia bacterium]
MIDILLKKAQGYEVVETVQEYAYDEEGNRKLLKEKVSRKNVPPDISAIKTYLEMYDKEVYTMTDEELKAEKDRLIKTLRKEKKNEQKEK